MNDLEQIKKAKIQEAEELYKLFPVNDYKLYRYRRDDDEIIAPYIKYSKKRRGTGKRIWTRLSHSTTPLPVIE